MAGGMEYEQAQVYRQAMFALVENRRHWKGPIQARVARDTPELRAALHDAIVHFTASVPDFTPNADGSMIVTAAGYYATVGA